MRLQWKTLKCASQKIPKVQNIYLLIVPINVKTVNGRYVSTYALLDTGSESTLVRRHFAKR